VSLTDISKSGRTILVVDDEADLLRLMQSALESEGYEVIPAKNADSAIQAFDSAHRPDLLLVDVVMPGMSGPMLVDHLRGIEPDLKVLFISGYDDRHVVQRYVLDQGFRLVPKPFTIRHLLRAIDAAINESKPARRKEPAH
jgi:CheY-like chemotaxis protein